MSMVETTKDVRNSLLLRREITCTFKGLAGKLKKLEAIDIIAKQYSLEGKFIVPINLRNETGKPMISGTFYIYDDEKLARKHVRPAIFKRLDKAREGGNEESKETPATQTKEQPEKKDQTSKSESKETKKGESK